jgi:sterol 24-C-methyltransferase
MQLASSSRLGSYLYRLSTIFKSFKALYSLSPEKVSSFLSSYNIYDHDWVDENELIKDMGLDYYQEVKRKIADYYSVLNHLCAIGHVEKMYIPPLRDLSQSILANQNLFEKKMSEDLAVPRGGKILDVGCGRGRIANHMARLTGAHVTGMNIDKTQIACAQEFAVSSGFGERCQFQVGDLNDLPLPFADNSFDGVYEVQAFTYSKDLGKLFKDIYRVLKPGARFACLDWAKLEKYDQGNPEHLALMKRIKPLIGAIGTPLDREYVSLLQEAGFKIVVDENASIGGFQAPLIENADRFFTRVNRLVNFFVQCKVLPSHFQSLFDRLTKDGEAFVEADKLGLVTTSYYAVAEKPLD